MLTAAAAAAAAGRRLGAAAGVALPAARRLHTHHDPVEALLQGAVLRLCLLPAGLAGALMPLCSTLMRPGPAALHGCACPTATLRRCAEYEEGQAPQVVPFEISQEEARCKFLEWQSGRARLAPTGLLPPGGPWRMRPALLPFWLFDVRARVEYAGSVGVETR